MRRLVVATAAVLVLAVGGVAWAAIPNADGNIYACYSTGNGEVRVQDDPAKPCPKSWSPLNWTAGQPDVPVTRTYVRLNQQRPSDKEIYKIDVFCDDGDVATGGGYDTETTLAFYGGPVVRVFGSSPLVNSAIGAYGWRVTFQSDFVVETIVNTWVICQHTE